MCTHDSCYITGEYIYWSSAEIPPDPTEIVNTVPFKKPRPMPTPAEASAVQVRHLEASGGNDDASFSV